MAASTGRQNYFLTGSNVKADDVIALRGWAGSNLGCGLRKSLLISPVPRMGSSMVPTESWEYLFVGPILQGIS